MAAIGETVFTGTGRGLYRLDSDMWTKLPVETSRAVYSLAVSENNLYVGTGPDLLGFTPIKTGQVVPTITSPSIKIFHSADLGASWAEITPSSKTVWRIPSGMLVLAAGETISRQVPCTNIVQQITDKPGQNFQGHRYDHGQ